MKNPKLKRIDKIDKIENIENINQNINIPVGQIVLINVNKNRESLVQQEPLDRYENDIKKDVDHLTKTKNTFTDKKLSTNDSKYQSIQNDLYAIKNVKNTGKPNVYQTPKMIEINNQKNLIQDVKYQLNQNNIDQLKQSTISLNHHYEQPNLYNKTTSIIRLNDSRAYDTVDGQSIKSNNISNNNSSINTTQTTATTTTATHYYERPIFNANANKKSSIRKPNLNLNKQLTIPNQLLDTSEINQIEFFYRSQRTFVFVSKSMANLYFTDTDLVNNGRYSSPRSDWSLSRTGIPLIIFNRGGTKCRLKRQIRIALAERHSGFQLFSDVIDNLSDYKKMHESFHTFYLSIDHRKMAGLSFDCPASADQFLEQIESITSDPINTGLSGPKLSKKLMNSKNQLNKAKNSAKSLKTKKFKKSDISQPCLFQHITNLSINDFERLYSLSTLVRAINFRKQETEEGSEQLSDSISKFSIDEQMSNNSSNLSNDKQIYLTHKHPCLPSSICSYSPISGSSISPSSSCSYSSE